MAICISAGLAALNWWISVDQGWIKLGHIQDDVLGPFPGSGMSIGGAIRPQNPFHFFNNINFHHWIILITR